MRRNALLTALVLSSAFVLGDHALAQSAAAPRTRQQTWEQNERGEWVQVNPPPSSRAATTPADEVIEDPALDQVENLLSGGRADAALKQVIDWIKSHPDAPDRDRGLFLLAEAYRQHGDGIRAFYHLDELMEFYPTSRLYYPALEKQYQIADDYLNGRKRVVLGFIPVGAKDEAVEMLYRIQERSPGSPIAERSLLRTADHYYDDSQFDLAADAYAVYLTRYPRSPEVPRVSLYRAFASLAQFRGLRFDATPLIDARAQLEDVLAKYPQLAAQEGVREFVERIDTTLASKVYATADFYRRTREPRAAVYLWRYLVKTYPDSREAELARRDLDRAPQWALETPTPGEGGAGTTGAGEPTEPVRAAPRDIAVPAGPQQ